MAKKAKAKKGAAKKDAAKDWEEKWQEALACLLKYEKVIKTKKAAEPHWHVSVSREEAAKEPEWENRVVCKECGQHWPYAAGAAYSHVQARAYRRMREVNGKWETHLLDDPKLEEKIREIYEEKKLELGRECIELIDSRLKTPPWWQFWRH